MRDRPPISLVVAALVAIVVAVGPLIHLVVRATEGGGGPLIDTLWRSRTLELALRSSGLAATVTALCLVIGVSLAWLVTRTDVPARRTVQVLVGLPLALPSYVAAWSWLGAFPSLAGGPGATIVLTSVSYPFVYLPVMAALRRCDPALEDVARTLGERPLSVFLRSTLPQVRPAAVGGGLLVTLYVLSDFGAVATMRYEVLTHVIYRSYRASFDRTPAAILGCVLAGLTLAIVVLERRTARRRSASTTTGATRPQPVVHLGRWRWPILMLPIARRAGLERPKVNHPIAVPGRDRPLIVDFAWPDLRMVVEADSQRFHGDWERAKVDRERDQLLALAGWRCHRFTRDRVAAEERMARRLAALAGIRGPA